MGGGVLYVLLSFLMMAHRNSWRAAACAQAGRSDLTNKLAILNMDVKSTYKRSEKRKNMALKNICV